MRYRWAVSFTPWPLYPWGKRPRLQLDAQGKPCAVIHWEIFLCVLIRIMSQKIHLFSWKLIKSELMTYNILKTSYTLNLSLFLDFCRIIILMVIYYFNFNIKISKSLDPKICRENTHSNWKHLLHTCSLETCIELKQSLWTHKMSYLIILCFNTSRFMIPRKCCSRNITAVIKKWAWDGRSMVGRIGAMRNACEIFVGKPEGKKTTWEN